jgi:pimeloyl-ACP methyl ester carboxylesterase
MKKIFIVLVISLCFSHVYASEIVSVKLSDNEIIKGKLELPEDSSNVPFCIIFIPGTGPNTYLNKRQFGNVTFNYYDLFAQEFNRRGIGFFTYNRRGVEIGDQPPYFDKIDSAKYKKYTPQQEALDLEAIISTLKKDKRLKQAKIALLGASEGTIIAAMVADKKKVEVNDLLLFGYANDNIHDIIKWQLSGKTSIINLRKYFDKNNDNVFNLAEYESADTLATWARVHLLNNALFNTLNLEKDSVIDYRDFAYKTVPFYDHLMKMVDEDNDSWIWNNYFRVTSNWMKAHFALEANKTRLLRIDIPIYIFQGIDDANAPVEGVFDIERRYNEISKTNLHCYTFDGHNHDLNYTSWPYRHKIPEGLKVLFDTAELMFNHAN